MKTNHSGRNFERPKHGQQGVALQEMIVIVAVLALLIAMFLPAWRASKRRGGHVSCSNSVKQIGLAFRQWAMDNGDKYPMQVSVTNGGTKELVGNGAAYPHLRVLSNELNTPKILVCWADTKRVEEMGKVMAAYALARGTNRGYTPPFFPTNFPVSYFVGVDAQPDRPKILLSGDANLTVGGKSAKSGLLSVWTNTPVAWAKPLRPYHGEGGNILTVDGSVHQVGNMPLRELLQETGVTTNRLAMP